MTTAAFIPEIWSARFTSRLRDSFVWGSRVNRNYEGDVAQAGDTVKVPTPTTTISVNDYVIGTDIAAATTTTGTTIDLDINKQKYYHFFVDDVDRVQEKPDQMEDAIGEAAHQMANQIDNDLRLEFDTAFASGRKIADVGGDPTAADNSAWAKAFLRAMAGAKKTMNEKFLPMENRWCIVAPIVMQGLEIYFLTNNAQGVFLPATTEQTLRNGFVGRLLGFDIQVSNNTPSATNIGGKSAVRCFLGQGNEAVAHVMQITETEAYRPERRFGDAIKGLMVYGSKAILPDRLYTIGVQSVA